LFVEFIIYFDKKSTKSFKFPFTVSSCVNVKSWFVFEQGTTILNLSYPQNNNIFYNTVNLAGTIDNTRGKLKVTRVKVKFEKKIVIKKLDSSGVKHDFKYILKHQYVEVVCFFGDEVPFSISN
jgi:hypothetical protein